MTLDVCENMVRKFTGNTGSQHRDIIEQRNILMKAKQFILAYSEDKMIKARIISDPISVISKTILKHERLIGEGLVKYQIIMKEKNFKVWKDSDIDSVDDDSFDSIWAPYQACKEEKETSIEKAP